MERDEAGMKTEIGGQDGDGRLETGYQSLETRDLRPKAGTTGSVPQVRSGHPETASFTAEGRDASYRDSTGRWTDNMWVCTM